MVGSSLTKQQLLDELERLRAKVEQLEGLQREPRQTEALLRATLNAIPDLITVHDRDLNVVLSNWHGHEYVAEKWQLGMVKCYKAYMERDEPCEPCHALEVFATGKTMRLEMTNPVDGITREISVYPVLDSSGKVIMVTEHVRDISRRIEAEQALRRSEAALRRAQKMSQVGSWELDVAKGERFWSEEICRIVGLAPGNNLAFEAFLERVHPDDRDVMEQGWQRLQRGESIDQTLRLVIDGKIKWIRGIAEVELAESGQPARMSGIVQDITERVQMEERLRQSQKMEAVGQLAGGVAHDFSNQLQVISGYAEEILSSKGVDSALRGGVQEIAEASARAERLVRQLLLFSRRQVVKPESLRLGEVVTGLMGMLTRVLGEHIHLDWRPGNETDWVWADKGMLEQVIINLCVNARDAMPDGGVLALAIEGAVLDADALSAYPWAKPGRFVLLSVRDNGCGMSPSLLETIFEPFFTTKQPGEGTGLGLATVYGVVKQHEGLVQARSRLREGSTFEVYLPVSAREAATGDHEVEDAVKGGTETILLGEDEDQVRELAKAMLERAGYTVLSACDGREALDLLAANLEQVSLVLLDVVMPVTGGKETYARIKKSWPEIPVVFMSGYRSDALQMDFVAQEGLKLIAKPFGRDELLLTVRETLDKKRRA